MHRKMVQSHRLSSGPRLPFGLSGWLEPADHPNRWQSLDHGWFSRVSHGSLIGGRPLLVAKFMNTFQAVATYFVAHEPRAEN